MKSSVSLVCQCVSTSVRQWLGQLGEVRENAGL